MNLFDPSGGVVLEALHAHALVGRLKVGEDHPEVGGLDRAAVAVVADGAGPDVDGEDAHLAGGLEAPTVVGGDPRHGVGAGPEPVDGGLSQLVDAHRGWTRAWRRYCSSPAVGIWPAAIASAMRLTLVWARVRSASVLAAQVAHWRRQ